MDVNERRQRAAEEAADWWLQLHSPQLTRAQREQLIDWLRESPIHVAEMLRMAQVHGALEQFEYWTRIAAGQPEARFHERPSVIPLLHRREHGAGAEAGGEAVDDLAAGRFARSASIRPSERAGTRHVFRRRVAAALAASAAIALVGSWWLLEARGQVIQTDRGERRELALTDGSIVQVDPQTRLRLRFDERARHVQLERGRALFRVARNPQRPFLVEANDTRVRAVGTAFGVERQDQGIVVTVAEGRVAVLPPNARTGSQGLVPGRDPQAVAPAAVARPLTSGERGAGPDASAAGSSGLGSDAALRFAPGELLLDAGEQLTVARSGSALPARKVDAQRALAWADGRLVFDDATVAEIVAQFNRYNGLQLRVTDEALARRSISGVFDASDPESFIAFIASVTPVQVTRERQVLTLSPPR